AALARADRSLRSFRFLPLATLWVAVSLSAETISPEFLSTLNLLGGVQVHSQVWAVGEHGTILSSDDLNHWQKWPTPTEATLTRMFFIDDQHGWVCGHDQTILHTEDGGKSWVLQKEDSAQFKPFFDILFLDAEHGWVVGADGAAWNTQDGGA